MTWAPPQASEETDGRDICWGRCSSWSLPVPNWPSVPAPQLHILSSDSPLSSLFTSSLSSITLFNFWFLLVFQPNMYSVPSTNTTTLVFNCVFFCFVLWCVVVDLENLCFFYGCFFPKFSLQLFTFDNGKKIILGRYCYLFIIYKSWSEKDRDSSYLFIC